MTLTPDPSLTSLFIPAGRADAVQAALRTAGAAWTGLSSAGGGAYTVGVDEAGLQAALAAGAEPLDPSSSRFTVVGPDSTGRSDVYDNSQTRGGVRSGLWALTAEDRAALAAALAPVWVLAVVAERESAGAPDVTVHGSQAQALAYLQTQYAADCCTPGGTRAIAEDVPAETLVSWLHVHGVEFTLNSLAALHR